MKNNYLHVLLLVCTILCISCEKSDDNVNPVIASFDDWLEVVDNTTTLDDLLLIAVGLRGEVVSIGNNSGNVINLGAITMDENNSYLAPQTIVATETTIYGVEYAYDASDTNKLLVYDMASNTTQSIPLTFPTTIEGEQIRIIALEWDNSSNLIALVDEDFYSAGSTRHLVNINLQDYSITEIGVRYNGDIVTSMKKVGNNIYISTWNEGLIEIDLTTNTLNTINNINGTRLAQISDTKLAFMQAYGYAIKGVRPSIIDTASQTVTPNFETASIQVEDILGGSVFVNQNYYNLVVGPGVPFGVLRTDFSSDKSILTPVSSLTLTSRIHIVNAIPVN